MSQGKKAEAVRDYFLKIEEQYEKTLNKISDLQKIAKSIVDFDMEIEKEMNKVDFSYNKKGCRKAL